MLLLIPQNTYTPNFGANLKSPKLKLSQKDFFIKIRGYGRNSEWADIAKETTDNAVFLLRKGSLIENVLKLITNGIVRANKLPLDIAKRTQTGILRTKRDYWQCCPDNIEAVTSFVNNRYKTYAKRLNKLQNNPLISKNQKLGISRINNNSILHGESFKINDSLDYIFKLFNDKFSKYLKKDVQKSDLGEIIDIVAEIRWVLAHSTPWLRGSDAISNVLMRAMFKSVGVKAYPPAKGISFDLEAYCRNLDDYKRHFNTFFEKPLKVIE